MFHGQKWKTNEAAAFKSRLREHAPLLPSADMSSHRDLLAPADTFARRHTGNNVAERAAMLSSLGYASLDALVDAAVPPHIRREEMNLPAAAGASAALAELRGIATQNHVFRSLIGMG